jgi:hypothetical protein
VGYFDVIISRIELTQNILQSGLPIKIRIKVKVITMKLKYVSRFKNRKLLTQGEFNHVISTTNRHGD